jgi:prevent-host-death family protein
MTIYGHNGHVVKTSLAHAKAHLSELVDQAEHKKRRILILRHGKPAAAIVPVDVAAPRRRRPPQSDEDARRSVQTFVDEFSAAEPDISAVEDLLLGRR